MSLVYHPNVISIVLCGGCHVFFSLQFLLIFFLSVLLVLWYRKLHWFHTYRFSNIIIISYRCPASEHDGLCKGLLAACLSDLFLFCFICLFVIGQLTLSLSRGVFFKHATLRENSNKIKSELKNPVHFPQLIWIGMPI